MTIHGANISGPSSLPQPQQPSNLGAFKGILRSPAFKTVTSCLNINIKDISGMTKQSGIDADIRAQLSQIKLIEINNERAEVLKSLGLQNTKVAILLSSEDDIEVLKKRLRDMKKTLLDKKTLKNVLSLLGLDIDLETLLYTDESGGLYLIRSGISLLEEEDTTS